MMDEKIYQRFKERRLSGLSITEIVKEEKRTIGYYSVHGYSSRFKQEYPNHKTKRKQSKLCNPKAIDAMYHRYCSYKARNMPMDKILKELGISQNELDKVLTKKHKYILRDHADRTLANNVKHTKSFNEKANLISEFRDKLLADYGTSLMDVPDDEPRLYSLQLANQMLDHADNE